MRRDHGEAADETGQQQAAGLDGDITQIEQIPARRTAGGGALQHGEGGEDRREHDDVGQQEDPEAETDDDALVGRTTCPAIRTMAELVGVDRVSDGGAHADKSRAVRACSRMWRRSRSMRATCAAGIMNSSSRRQAKATKTPYAPARPNSTSHQICQIIANPISEEKKAVTTPVGVLRGISIAS